MVDYRDRQIKPQKQRRNSLIIQDPSNSFWVDFAVGSGYVCGIRNDLSLLCRGSNVAGKLGLGVWDKKGDNALEFTHQWKQVGSKKWKRYLSDNMMARDSDFQKAKHIMTIVQNNEKVNQTTA